MKTYKDLYNKRVQAINFLRKKLKEDPSNKVLEEKINKAEEDLISQELQINKLEGDDYFRSYNPDFDNNQNNDEYE